MYISVLSSVLSSVIALTGGCVTDPEEVAAATAVLRRTVPVVVDDLRDAEQAFADAWLDRTATMCGFRECRELIAVHRVAMGEAVGTAAAMCARARIKPRDLDVSGLIAKLRSQKVYLG